jgi:hypothetical protein
MKQVPEHLKVSNVDEKGLPLRLDSRGVERDISRPYPRVGWKLVYVAGEGAVFVPKDLPVKPKHVSDF